MVQEKSQFIWFWIAICVNCRPPKVQLYEKTEAAIERSARLGEWSTELKAMHKQALAIPHPDLSNYVRWMELSHSPK